MSAFVPSLLARGLSAVVFDAPGHGASGRGMSSAVQFADAIRRLQRESGPFHGAVAHSLGTAAVALALRDGLALRRLAFLGPAAAPPAWARAFAERLGVPEPVIERLRARSERRLRLRWDELDVTRLAAGRDEPLLVVHDRQDREVDVNDGRAIAAAWKGARLVETTGLGHNRVLRDAAVVDEVVRFVADGAPARCACGAGSADDCEACRIERDLFDRDARFAATGDATIAAWSSSSVPPSTWRH
jgi:pimeloyl-ACP methyl ester carboxylesterase